VISSERLQKLGFAYFLKRWPCIETMIVFRSGSLPHANPVKFLLNTNMNENVQKVAKAFFCYLDASAPESPVLSYRYFVNRNYNDVTGERCFWPPVKIGSDLLSTWESLANGDFKKPCVDPCFDLKAAGGHFAGWDLEKCQVVTVCSPEDHVQLNGLSAVKCMHYHGSSDLMDKFRSVKQPPKIMCSKESLRTAKHLRLRYVTVEVSTEEKKAPSPKEVGGLDSNGDIFRIRSHFLASDEALER